MCMYIPHMKGHITCNIEISLKNTIAIFLTYGALMPASRSLMFRLSIPNDQLWVEQDSTLTFSISKVLIEQSTRKPKNDLEV